MYYYARGISFDNQRFVKEQLFILKGLNRLARLCKVLAFGAVLLLFTSEATGQNGFVVEGVFTTYLRTKENTQPSAEPNYKQLLSTTPFIISWRGSDWKIRLFPNDEGINYIETASNESEFYKVTSTKAQSSVSPPANGLYVTDIGFVYNGNNPMKEENPAFSILWFAFASAGYYNDKNKELKDGDLLNDISKGHKAGSLNIREDAAVATAFISKGERISLWIPSKNGTKSPWPSPFDEGFVDYEYVVTEWKDFGGGIYPGSAQSQIFTLFRDPPSTPSIYRAPIVQHEITVNSASVLQKNTDLRPIITNSIYVQDHRFSEVPNAPTNFTYTIVNGKWLNKTDRKLQEILSLQSDDPLFAKRIAEKRDSRGKFILSIFGITLLMFGGYLIAKLKKQSRINR